MAEGPQEFGGYKLFPLYKTFYFCTVIMRRLLVIALLTVYSAFAAGVPVYAHWCGGQVVKKSILLPTGGCTEEEDEPDDCCKDDTTLVKLEKAQKHEVNVWQPAPAPMAVIPGPALFFGNKAPLFDAEVVQLAAPAVEGFGDLPPPVPLYIFFSCLKLAGC